jgi:RimJ/RimL family protein N-acetyltransferase
MRGYGAAILAYAEQAPASAGYRRAEPHVLRANIRARNLYERCGWTLVGDGEAHHDGPQVIYEKPVAS